jgi:hypothetical protein
MVVQITPFIGDGAYDTNDVFTAVSERHPNAAVAPPRSTAVESETAPDQSDTA